MTDPTQAERERWLEECPCGCDTPISHPDYARLHGDNPPFDEAGSAQPTGPEKGEDVLWRGYPASVIEGLVEALREARPYVFNRTQGEDWRAETARAILARVDAALAHFEDSDA